MTEPIDTGIVNLDELTVERKKQLEDRYGPIFNKTRQCAEGLITKEPALLHDGQRSFAGEQTTEHRCELDADLEHDWHEDGEYRWQTY